MLVEQLFEMSGSTDSIRVFPLEKVNHNLIKELFIDNFFFKIFCFKITSLHFPLNPQITNTEIG